MSLQETIEKLNDLDPSDIDVNNMGSWPLAVKFFLWLILFCAVLSGIYKLDLADLHINLASVEAKESELRIEFEQKVQDAANLEAYRVQMVEMKKSFQALLQQLPQKTEVPGLLDDISNKGLDSGLTFNTIDLQTERTQEFYVELPIEINVTGGYHDFGSFVSGVAGLPRIVTLHDFTISNLSKRGSSGNQLRMNITAKTYRYGQKEEE